MSPTTAVIRKTVTEELVRLDLPGEDAPRGYTIVPLCVVDKCDQPRHGYDDGLCRRHYTAKLRGRLPTTATA